MQMKMREIQNQSKNWFNNLAKALQAMSSNLILWSSIMKWS